MACAHMACKCLEAPVVSGGKAYCSESCASAAKAASSACTCGHKGCPSSERKSPNPPGEPVPSGEIPIKERKRSLRPTEE